MAFEKHSQLWNVTFEPPEATMIARGADLHGLASDDEFLYWAGHYESGRFSYTRGERQPLRRFEFRGHQHDLAVGDAPYGLGEHGAVWRLGERRNTRVSEPKDYWQTYPEILAAKDIVIFRVIDTDERKSYLWRVRAKNKKGHRLEVNPPCQDCEALDGHGRLVFLQDDAIQLLAPRSTEADRLFDADDIFALCWCGQDLCTFSTAADELRRHDGTSPTYEVIATDIGRPTLVSCSAEYVSWSSPVDGMATIHVMPATIPVPP